MRNIILKSCMFIVAFSFMLFACREDEQLQVPSQLENVNELAKVYGGDVFTTEAKVSRGNEDEVVINFNTLTASKTLRLQVNEGSKLGQIPTSGKYTILYLKHIAILSETASGQKYLLTVSNPESLNLTKKIPESYLKGINVLDGYGLIMSTLMKSGRVGECTGTSAGGAGASSCSNDCCSTSCKSGLDAYCGKTCECKTASLPPD